MQGTIKMDNCYTEQKRLALDFVEKDIKNCFCNHDIDSYSVNEILNMQFQKSLLVLNKNLENLIATIKETHNSKNNA